MKHTSTISIAISVAITLIASSVLAESQPQIQAPNYSTWQIMRTRPLLRIHSGKEVTLLSVAYAHKNTDISEIVNIWNDEDNKPWLMFYLIRSTADIKFYLFEKTGDNWTFVKDFTNSDNHHPEKEVNDFLKIKYDLSMLQ